MVQGDMDMVNHGRVLWGQSNEWSRSDQIRLQISSDQPLQPAKSFQSISSLGGTDGRPTINIMLEVSEVPSGHVRNFGSFEWPGFRV